MNILLCSAGRRVKLVHYFKQELNKLGGRVVAVDCDPTAPALHFADISEVVPRMTDPDYLEIIMQLCLKYEINAVISLIDPELSLLAEHKEEFAEAGITIIVSDREVVDICFDKYRTYQLLQQHNLPGVPTFITMEEILSELQHNQLRFPLIIKPRRGSASIGITKINSIDELSSLWKENGELVAQPFIEGNEFGIDLYVDLINQRATNIFCKRKIKMRAGETDKSISFYDVNLVELAERVVTLLGAAGPIDIDCFQTENGYLISEINPRFGGGYPHAYEEGQNFVLNILNNLRGMGNTPEIGNYSEGSIMIKYDDVLILRSSEENKATEILQGKLGGVKSCTK